MIGFTAVALIILCLVVSLCAFIQFSYGLYDINKMLMPASRAAAVCTSMEDAQKQAQLVAESESTDKNIENIKYLLNMPMDTQNGNQEHVSL